MKSRVPRDLQIPLDRITYRDGQLLASRDMQDDVHRDQRLRSLHTRYLHDTWGVALGFEVHGAANDASVRVGPGYAVDSSGRDLLLAETLDLPVPATSTRAAFVLVMSYPADSEFQPRPELETICIGGGLDPRNERPVFAWREPDDTAFGAEVPLAAVTVEKGALIAAPDFRVRRNARRMIRPHMGFGTAEVPHGFAKGFFQFHVDTTDAGFSKTPYYFARVTKPDGLEGASINALGFIDEPTSTGFNFSMPLFFESALGRTPKFTIAWLGIEPVKGCEPVLNFQLLFLIAGLLRRPLLALRGLA